MCFTSLGRTPPSPYSEIRPKPYFPSCRTFPSFQPISTTILHLHTFHTTPIHYPQALPCPYTIHNPFYITQTPQKSSSPNLPQGEEKETVHENCLALQSELLNNFRCILSYISMSTSCNLCFSLSMIG